MTVDDSLFLGTWTDKQSSIPYHDVCDAGLDFVGFFSLRSDMSAIWLCDEVHFWWNGYVNKQNCRIWSEANPQVYVETPLHPGKLTVSCALWAGGILLQKR
ncbi:hypothetical protein TNCV_4056121 [Trichonephila clavipes]|nr:hypothetical protein TNCV_4056121 [Trichonephila clavipes]